MSATVDTIGEHPASNGRARYYFLKCSALRAGKGVTKKALAADSGIDRTTLDKIEGGKVPVTEERIMRVFNCLNERYYKLQLATADFITAAPSSPPSK